MLSLLKLTTNIPYFVPSVIAPVRQTRSHFRCVQPLSRPICLQMKFPLRYLIDISKIRLGPRSTTYYTKDKLHERTKNIWAPILDDFLTHYYVRKMNHWIRLGGLSVCGCYLRAPILLFIIIIIIIIITKSRIPLSYFKTF